MKKILSIFFSLVMILSLGATQVAFAAEIEPVQKNIFVSNNNDTEIQPRGSLNGYGSTWYSAGDRVTDSFIVPVTGIPWANAQTTLKIESFDRDTCVRVQLYSPNGVCLYDTMSWSGGYLSMSQPEVKKKFSPGSTGNYTVQYEIWKINGSAPSSGRIMCWIY